MERFPGKQADTFKYIYNDRLYYLDVKKRAYDDSYSLRCAQKNITGCSATIRLASLADLHNRIEHQLPFDVEGPNPQNDGHFRSCIADPNLMLKEKFLEELLGLARISYDDFSDIYKRTLRKEM